MFESDMKINELTQYLITAELSHSAESPMFNPKKLNIGLNELFLSLSGNDTPTIKRLSYSTPINNSGWTGYLVSDSLTMAFHHWDSCDPGIIQIDLVYKRKALSEEKIKQSIDNFFLTYSVKIQIVSTNQMGCKLISKNDFNMEKRCNTGPDNHSHLIVRAVLKKSYGLTKSYIYSTSKKIGELINFIGMKQLSSVEYTTNHEDFAEFIVGITTSHVSLKCMVLKGEMELIFDIFSCKKIEVDKVRKWMVENMEAEIVDGIFVERYPNLAIRYI